MGDTIKTKKRSIPIQAQRLEQGMNEPSKANVRLSPDISILFHHTLILTTLMFCWHYWRSWSITKKIGFSFTGPLEKLWALVSQLASQPQKVRVRWLSAMMTKMMQIIIIVSPLNVFVFRTKNSSWRKRIEPIRGCSHEIPSSKILSENCPQTILHIYRLLSGTSLCAPDCRLLATYSQSVEGTVYA